MISQPEFSSNTNEKRPWIVAFSDITGEVWTGPKCYFFVGTASTYPCPKGHAAIINLIHVPWDEILFLEQNISKFKTVSTVSNRIHVLHWKTIHNKQAQILTKPLLVFNQKPVGVAKLIKINMIRGLSSFKAIEIFSRCQFSLFGQAEVDVNSPILTPALTTVKWCSQIIRETFHLQLVVQCGKIPETHKFWCIVIKI